MTDQIVVLCMPGGAKYSTFPDDVEGACDGCGTLIHWRPHQPVGANVRHLCARCCCAQMEVEREPFTVGVTAETAREVVDYLKVANVKDES